MLAGDLSEFTLPDLFQLLGLTKKSGALRIAHGGAEGRVWFDDGDVCFALADDRRMPLGARLVASGHMDAQSLQNLLREHRGGTAVDVAATLLSSGEIEESTLEGFIREQVHDALFALLRLEKGPFQFDPQGAVSWQGPRYVGAEILDEAHRRLDEWSRLASHMPDPKSILSVVPNPPGGSPLTIDRDQWHLVALVDGKRTVAQIVDLGGKGDFATGKLLGELVESGLLEAHDRAGEGALANLLAGRHALRQLEEVALGAVSTAPSPAGSRSRGPDGTGDEPGADGSRRLGGRRPSWHTEEAGTAVGVGETAPKVEDGRAAADGVTAPDGGAEDESTDNAAVTDEQAAPVPGDGPRQHADGEGTSAPAEPDADETTDETTDETSGDVPEAGDEDGGVGRDEGGAPAPHPKPAHPRSFDRAQVARELASLGLDDDPPGPQRVQRPVAGAEPARSTNGSANRATADGAAGSNAAPGRSDGATDSSVGQPGRPMSRAAADSVGYGPDVLARDDDITRGLLLRLIDGVKGA